MIAGHGPRSLDSAVRFPLRRVRRRIRARRTKSFRDRSAPGDCEEQPRRPPCPTWYVATGPVSQSPYRGVSEGPVAPPRGLSPRERALVETYVDWGQCEQLEHVESMPFITAPGDPFAQRSRFSPREAAFLLSVPGIHCHAVRGPGGAGGRHARPRYAGPRPAEGPGGGQRGDRDRHAAPQGAVSPEAGDPSVRDWLRLRRHGRSGRRRGLGPRRRAASSRSFSMAARTSFGRSSSP